MIGLSPFSPSRGGRLLRGFLPARNRAEGSVTPEEQSVKLIVLIIPIGICYHLNSAPPCSSTNVPEYHKRPAEVAIEDPRLARAKTGFTRPAFLRGNRCKSIKWKHFLQ